MNLAEKEPKIIVSLRRKVDEQGVALLKSEKTIREQQLEIDRLKQMLAEALSGGLNVKNGVIQP